MHEISHQVLEKRSVINAKIHIQTAHQRSPRVEIPIVGLDLHLQLVCPQGFLLFQIYLRVNCPSNSLYLSYWLIVLISLSIIITQQ